MMALWALLLLIGLGFSSKAQAGGEAVAEVDGVAISSEEVEKSLAAQLSKLEEQIYNLKRQKVEALINERLLEKEAAKRGLSVPALLDAEVTSKVGLVTEQEIESFYQANKAQIKGEQAQVREQIRTRLQNEKLQARREVFLQSLRSRAKVVMNLKPPPVFPAEVRVDELVERQISPHNGDILVADNTTTGIRSLIAQSGAKSVLQSSLDLRNPVRLVDDYTQIMALITSLHPTPLLVFNIGLGGSVLPRFHLSRYPTSFVDSVEIDKVMVALAKKHFQAEQAHHTIIEGDGAAVLKTQTKLYQVVWIDAFTPDGVPEVFLADEFLSTLKVKMTPQNLVVFNLWVETPERFRETVKKYKSGYSSGIIVKIPLVLNQILAVGNNLRLTCANFFAAYEAWLKQKLVTVRWSTTSGNPLMEICTDVS